MATKREYLITLGLAKEGRGRFSREALEAIAKAEAGGTVFDETVTVNVKPEKADKPVKVKIVGPKPLTSEDFADISPKAVREWANANPDLLPAGVTVSARGRVDLRIMQAYKDKAEKIVTRDEEESNGKIIFEMPARTFPEGTRFRGEKNGKTDIVNDRQVCLGPNGCGVSLGYCRCGDRTTNRMTTTALGLIEVVPVGP